MRFFWIIAIFCFSAPALAQDFVRHDSSKPIEITADTLEVKQKYNLAIFNGNVVAIQGKMRLAADKMRVHYHANTNTEGKQSVSRIEVMQNVRLATQQESATGDKGIYDVDAKLLTLKGDVVLSKGKNVVKGETLTYNVTSGQSNIVGGKGTSSGRVKGVFVPQEK